jgi:hypothetical protein
MLLADWQRAPTAGWMAAIGAGHRRRSGHAWQTGHWRKGLIRADALCCAKVGDSHGRGHQPGRLTGGGRGQLLEEALLKAERGAIVV